MATFVAANAESEETLLLTTTLPFVTKFREDSSAGRQNIYQRSLEHGESQKEANAVISQAS